MKGLFIRKILAFIFMLGVLLISQQLLAKANIKTTSVVQKKINDFPSLASVKEFHSAARLSDHIGNLSEDTVLFFFASWCEYCRQEMVRYLERVKNGQCPRVVMVGLDESFEALDKYLNSLPSLKSEIFWDKENRLKRELQIKVLPAFVYIGKDKIIKKVGSGTSATQRILDFMISHGEGRKHVCI